ncbi:hypothetical protein [Dyadobacter sp. NIV53]|uniref:hypothetical protein n=1 Tax=Dyadobacter sp. NIV53 TaxID=2861765 RepID=UPI001C87126A|nr:hypothetical protein [Dyadobacter sp. NIV53]
MEDSKEDILKKLIQKAGTETPSQDFTESVMLFVGQETIILNTELKNLLQESILEKPSADFMSKVMAGIPCREQVTNRKLAVEPIIGRNIWYLVAAVTVTLIAFLLFCYQATSGLQNTPSQTTGIDKAFLLISSNITTIPSFYSASLIAISSLLLMDYFLRNKILKRSF